MGEANTEGPANWTPTVEKMPGQQSRRIRVDEAILERAKNKYVDPVITGLAINIRKLLGSEPSASEEEKVIAKAKAVDASGLRGQIIELTKKSRVAPNRHAPIRPKYTDEQTRAMFQEEVRRANAASPHRKARTIEELQEVKLLNFRKEKGE